MTKKNPTLINFDECNNIFEVVQLMKNEEDGVPFYIDARTVNMVKNGYEEAIQLVRSKLESFGRPDFITEEQYDEVNSHFNSILFNAAHRVHKGEAYADDVQFIISFLVYSARLLEIHGMKLEQAF